MSPVPECAESDVKSFYLAPIGNGPFMMDGKWEDGQEINLKKVDDYDGDKAKIDGIHFQVIKDVETAYKEFQAGTTSATFPLLRSTLPRRIAACPRTATPWATASACCSAPSLPPTT